MRELQKRGFDTKNNDGKVSDWACVFGQDMLGYKDMLTTKKKAAAIKGVAHHDSDTGSASVQVALLSTQIDELTKHLKKNKKDFHSRRGLLQMVADRRTHLHYLEKNDKRRYDSVVKKLGLKK